MVVPGARLRVAAGLQQLLELRSQPAEAGLQARHGEQPVAAQRLAGAGIVALPQVAAGREQVELHRHPLGEGLQQLHLHRRQAAEAEQAQGLAR